MTRITWVLPVMTIITIIVLVIIVNRSNAQPLDNGVDDLRHELTNYTDRAVAEVRRIQSRDKMATDEKLDTIIVTLEKIDRKITQQHAAKMATHSNVVD